MVFNRKFPPDNPEDIGARFPKPPKPPDEVLSDPAKMKKWKEYWEQVHQEWATHLKDNRNKSRFNEVTSEWMRKNFKGNEGGK